MIKKATLSAIIGPTEDEAISHAQREAKEIKMEKCFLLC